MMAWNKLTYVLNSLIWLTNALTSLVVGSAQRKSRGRSLKNALRDDPNALYCANCGLILKSHTS